MTRLVALLGDPVAHSLSPALQNAAFRAAGVDGVYVALRTGADELKGLLEGIARAGGAGNVTLPHKARARAIVEVATPAAVRTGAVNTFWLEGGRIHGDNTDVEGFRMALADLVPEGVRGARVLLLGAGGAARAVLAALVDAEVDEVSLWNRTPERARALASDFEASGLSLRLLPAAPGPGHPAALVVHATRLGLDAADPLPLAVEALPRGAAVLDLVYGAGETRLVRDARAAGHRAADGGTMLVGQGAAAFRRWWGQEAPLEAYHEALETLRRAHRGGAAGAGAA
jgi:shikimate dehydrogenase